MATTLTNNQVFTLSGLAGRMSYNIQISSLGAATDVAVQLSNDGVTFTTDRTVTAVGHVGLKCGAARALRLVGTGATDFVATISQSDIK